MAEQKIIRAVRILGNLLKENGINISRIVVFGSYVKGNRKEGSDMDILVISKNFEGKDIFERIDMSQGIHRKLIEEITIPVDIMYYSPTEWEEGGSLTIDAAKEEGRVFY
jgi:predicted nucleotidyltransferase